MKLYPINTSILRNGLFSYVLFLTELKKGYSDRIVRFQRSVFLGNESKSSIVLVIHVMRCRKKDFSALRFYRNDRKNIFLLLYNKPEHVMILRLKLRWISTKDSRYANTAEQRKGFVQVNLQYAKKSILSINRAFYGLQNGLFNLFVCAQKSGAKSLIWKAVLRK